MYQGSDRHKENYRKAAALGVLSQKSAREKRIAEYYLSPKKCLQCDQPLSYEKKNENNFCQKSCSASFNNKARGAHSQETKDKISQTTKKSLATLIRKARLPKAQLIEKICPKCKKEFSVKAAKKKQSFCTRSCLLDFRVTDVNEVERIKNAGRTAIQRQMKTGTWKGWSGKGIDKESYPEQFVRELLDQSGVGGYEKQKQVSRFAIDFAFPGKMIALEVDGKQHEYPKQKAHDKERDEFLSNQGWIVFRLKWKSVKSPKGKNEVIQQFQEFIALLDAAK